MKICLLSLLMAFCVQLSYSQYSSTSKRSEYYKAFLEKDLMVELSGVESFDNKLLQAVKKAWPKKEIIPFLADGDHKVSTIIDMPVIGPLRMTVSIDEKERTENSFALYVFTPSRMSTRRVIAMVPYTCYSGYLGSNDAECDFVEALEYKIDVVVNSLREISEYVGEAKRIGNQMKNFQIRFNEDHQKLRLSAIESKKLYVNAADLTESLGKEKLEASYKYEVVVLSESAFQDLVERDEKDCLVLMAASNGRCVASVFDLKEDKLIFVEFDRKANTNKSTRETLRPVHIKHLQKRKLIKKRILVPIVAVVAIALGQVFGG